MSDDRPAISRRDLLRGNFVRTQPETDNNAEDSRTQNRPGLRGMVMRYPKATDDVSTISSSSRGTSGNFRRTIPVLRPPGAVDEPTFLSQCTRCDECITACPHDAIVHAPPRFREAAGTPIIDADRQPCRMCEDFPCIDACDPDVLSHLIPKAMGTARILHQTCIAHQGMTCTVCSEHCPVPGAIEMTNGKPEVVEQSCTGCGVCRYVCPSPQNAVMIMPTFVRPPRPDDET